MNHPNTAGLLMRWIVVLAGMVLAVVLSGCSSGQPDINQQTDPVVYVPDVMRGGQAAEWRVEWDFGQGPYDVHWSFYGGADPEDIDVTDYNGESHTAQVTMVNDTELPARYMYYCRVMDALHDKYEMRGMYEVAPTGQ